MRIRYIMRESAQALRANKLRSSLTVIGIVVGIFSVTAMLALGEGLQQNVLDRISSFSQGDVSVSGTLTRADLAWVKEQPYVAYAMGSLSLPSTSLVAFNTDFNVSVQSTLGDFASIQALTITTGTAFDFTDPALDEREAIATAALQKAVLTETGRDIIDQYVTIGGQLFRIIAIADVPTAGFSRTDGSVYIPYRAAVETLASTDTFASIGVKLKDSNNFNIAGQALLEGLNLSRGASATYDKLFNVSSAQSIIESAQQTTAMISLFLGIVGGIALFVGGIGTMNMMLTTVTERTKEIGLRKAIGAKRRDILFQIIIESVFLTMIGGVIGILLAGALAALANKLLSGSTVISVIVSPQVVMLAVSVSIAVGIVFGLYPANRASKLQPVDALRAE
jgi:putative ABC transport system permease protein